MIRRVIRPCTVALLFAGCSPPDAARTSGAPADQVPEPERRGGTAVVALATEPPTLNGLAAVDLESMWIHQSMLSMPLLRYDRENRPQPWLAERWDTLRIAPDTLQLTFHLRRDIRWHDGVPTTAEDVRFTYERMRDPRVGFPRRGYLERWAPEAEVVDSFTVRFLLRPHAEFLDFWSWDVVLPAHLLRDVPPGELRDHSFGHRPVGNGPFRFAHWARGRELVLEANPEFPEALGGRAYLDRITFRVIPDPTARLTEFSVGGADLFFVAPDKVEQLPADQLISYPNGAWAQIAWNTKRRPFDDARVRRALSLAIDRHALFAGVLYGHAEPGRWTATPTHWQYDAADPETEPRYDPDEARRMLAEAGWSDRDGDGTLEDGRGRPFRFTLLSFRESSTHPHSSTVLQAQLRRVGIDMRIRLLEEGTAFAFVTGKVNPEGQRVRDFDALLTNWETGRSSDDSWFLHSRNRNEPLGLTGYSDARADAWMDTLATTLDRATARPLWREYHRLMVREAPVTVLYYPRNLAAVSNRLQGVEMFASAPYVTAPTWWIHPDRRR